MIKIGIVGLGLVAQKAHLPSFANNPNVKITAICDLDNHKLKHISKKYKIKKLYLSIDKMIKKENFDGIVIATNKEKNSEIAYKVLRAEIPLLSEKPTALNSRIACKLLQISKKKKVNYIVGYMKRFDNGVIKLKKILQKKKKEKIKSVYYENFLGDSYKNPILKKNKVKKKNHFVNYLNSYSHNINLLRYLFGDIKIKSSSLSKNGEGIIFFKSKKTDIIFNSQYSKSNKWNETMHINFIDKKIIIKFPPPLEKNTNATINIVNFKNSKNIKVKIKNGWSFTNQANAFVELLRRKKNKTLCNSKDATEDIKIIEKIF